MEPINPVVGTITRSVLQPLTFISVLGLGLVGFGTLASADTLTRQLMISFGILIILVSVAMVSIMFLRSPSLLVSESHSFNSDDKAESRRQPHEFKDIIERLSNVEAKLASEGSSQNAVITELDKRVSRRLENYMADDVIRIVSDRLSHEIGEVGSLDKARAAFEASTIRLAREIDRLVKSSAYNLGIGGTISLGGISALTYFLVFENSVKLPAIDFAIHYAPRIGLVILIEVFAFFFLNLYRSSQVEIKYVHNELTNIEQRVAAFEISRLVDDRSEITSVVEVLLSTERNSVLKKGDSTIEIEKSRIAAGVSTAATLSNLGALVSNLKLKG